MNKKLLLSILMSLIASFLSAQTFTEIFEGDWGQGRDDTRPSVADLDNDGLLDILVGESNGVIYHYEQVTANSLNFSLISDHFGNIDIGEYSAPTFADINSDGLADLIVGDDYGGLHYFQRNKDTGIEHKELQPQSFRLFQNYPNPFNPATRITYNLPRATRVTLKIYNIQGQEIKMLVNEFQRAGVKSVVWDGLDSQGNQVASGIYLYRLEAGEFSVSQKMILAQ